MASRAASLNLAALLLLPALSAAQQGPRLLQVDAAHSRIYAVTHRSGLLSFLGHEHAILAPRWTTRLCWDPASHQASRAEFVVDARALEIDADSVRALAGLGEGPSPQQRAQIQARLHEPKNLNSAEFPELGFHSSAVRGSRDTLWVRGTLQIRAQPRDVEMAIVVQERSDGSMWLAGTLPFRLTDFGIKPESIAAVVKVADVAHLHVGLLVAPSDRPCD